MASRKTFLVAAILAVTMPSFVKGQGFDAKSNTSNIVKGQNFTFNITKAHELFDEDLYTLASDVVKNNHSELNLNQMSRLLNVARALDADLGNKIRNLTGLTQTNSTELEMALRQGMEDGTIEGITMQSINDYSMAVRQMYVTEVIKELDLQPSLFNLTGKQFCLIFDVCKYVESPTNISSSTVKLGLELALHIQNLTGKVETDQGEILQRRSDDSQTEIEAVESTTNASSTTEAPKVTQEKEMVVNDAPENKNSETVDNDHEDHKHSEVETKSDPKTDASTQQGTSSATLISLSSSLLMILVVSSHIV